MKFNPYVIGKQSKLNAHITSIIQPWGNPLQTCDDLDVGINVNMLVGLPGLWSISIWWYYVA